MARGRNDGARSESTLRLCRSATVAAATELRHLLRAWSGALGVPTDQRGAIELACYEAMANVACHAYADRSTGMMELNAVYSHTTQPPRVTVTISDHGHWRTPAVDPGHTRGRGMRMIRSLSGAADFVGSNAGTTVRMSWDLSLASAVAS